MMLTHPRYQAGETLGRGAQGVVLRVVDREQPLRALVAKVLAVSVDGASLAAEFSLLSRLRIRGLVRAHDWGRDEITKAAFFVEDFVSGPDASEYLQAAKTPDERARRATKILADVATTLGALHASGFVHGDLKPAHVRVTANGETKLLDLGCAVTHGASALGATEKWAAPEVLAAGAVTPRADLYSLGALVRDVASPMAPSLEAIIEKLTAKHPADRPESAHDVLSMLGRTKTRDVGGARPPPIGRDAELRWLLDPRGDRVRYLVGPAGSGKSHLLEEALLVGLLAGRHARRVSDAVVPRLAAFLRGSRDAWPFSSPPSEPTLLVIDDVERMPRELAEALMAHRCRATSDPIVVIVSALEPPVGAACRELLPMNDAALAALCEALGVTDIEAMKRASGGMPGVVAAAAGRAPLSKDAVLERVRGISDDARLLLASIALAGGSVPHAFGGQLLPQTAIAAERELLAQGLLTRADGNISLFARAIAKDLAEALGSCSRVDLATDAALSLDRPPPSILMALARSPYPPTRRVDLLARAATEARSAEQRAEETDALLELASDPKARTVDRVVRLERLLRDAGAAQDHARVVEWLGAMGTLDPAVSCLALRRRAERAARGGQRDEALTLASLARDLAGRDTMQQALALSTLGAVQLYASEWALAQDALLGARSMLATTTLEDREERARLDHNLGVVGLVQNDLPRAIEALSRSLDTKRGLRDLAGVRSCLLNLGIAHAKAGNWAEAERALDEAFALARALGQRAGAGWCLVARCDLEVRRKNAPAARQFAREAEAVLDALPPAVRADLWLALAEADLLEGNGADALARIESISPELRADDALLDARTCLVIGRAHLCTLPSNRHAAARSAIAALRRARSAGLAEIEPPAIALFRAARGVRVESTHPMQTIDVGDRLWEAAEAASNMTSADDVARAILHVVVSVARAERAMLARVRDGDVTAAWGLDVDGLPIASATERARPHLRTASHAPKYVRDAEMANGRGSRMIVARAGLLLVVEQRFVVGAFDAVPAAFFERAATLAALALRELSESMVASPDSSSVAVAPIIHGATTVLPSRESHRAFPAILGQSRALRHALSRLDSAIDSDLPVLILGETGTGKELFARALHDFGPRSKGPFVALNCAAVPESLFEAELFGHVRGAFTSADRARSGLLARAEGGTLFLDEIGDLAPARQAALLRALETRHYRAVGSDDERAFDVRIVSATHRDLEAATHTNAFRSDLLYRLRVLEVAVPPLREREGDVMLLAAHFLKSAGSTSEISPRALEAIGNYAWPGNVRELMHHMQRLAALRAPRLDWEHLPRELRASPSIAPPPALDERTEVVRALAETDGNISHAATRLGITRHGLKKRMLRLGMRSKS